MRRNLEIENNELEEYFKVILEKISARNDEKLIQGLQEFSLFDTKKLFPVFKRTVYGKEFDSKQIKEDSIRNYFVYKALTTKTKNNIFSDKNASSFDPDNSTGKCPFVFQLYQKLWGFNYEYSCFGTITPFEDFGNKKLLLGGDCLNSLQTSINTLFKTDKISCIESFVKNEKEYINKIRNSSLNNLFSVSHSPGNLGLVPAYFNGYRGTKSCIRDYLPQSLFLLKNIDKYDYNICNELEKYTKNEKYKNGKSKNHFKNFTSKLFVKYVNVMFLWDLVKYTDENKVMVCDFTEKEVTELQLNYIENDLNAWAQGATRFIKRRGLFMAAMLYTSLYCPNDYQQITNAIFTDELMKNDDNKYGYSAAISKILEKPEICDDVKNVFTKSELLINELSEKSNDN